MSATDHIAQYESTATLISRYLHHIAVVNAMDARLRMKNAATRTYHMIAARGIHKLLADRACAGDTEAGNAALGAPHWLTFSDTQVKEMR